jgi:hypothetical protein
MNDYPLFKDQLEDQIQTMLDKVLDDDKDDNDFIDCLDEELPGFFDDGNRSKGGVVGNYNPSTPTAFSRPRLNTQRTEPISNDDFASDGFPVYNQHLSTSLSNHSNVR